MAKSTEKAPAKLLQPKKPVKAAVKAQEPSQVQYAMPMEVKDWIERANSTIQHLRGEVDRLKQDNIELKAYKKWAEHRILRSDYE